MFPLIELSTLFIQSTEFATRSGTSQVPAPTPRLCVGFQVHLIDQYHTTR